MKIRLFKLKEDFRFEEDRGIDLQFFLSKFNMFEREVYNLKVLWFKTIEFIEHIKTTIQFLPIRRWEFIIWGDPLDKIVRGFAFEILVEDRPDYDKMIYGFGQLHISKFDYKDPNAISWDIYLIKRISNDKSIDVNTDYYISRIIVGIKTYFNAFTEISENERKLRCNVYVIRCENDDEFRKFSYFYLDLKKLAISLGVETYERYPQR